MEEEPRVRSRFIITQYKITATMFKHVTKGFTLIELLVVIAIIGILSSVVLASLNDARQKSRDAKRVADIKQVQLALQLRFDNESNFPTQSLGPIPSNLAPTYIATIPVDPLNATRDEAIRYRYVGVGGTDFVLRATLENASHPALSGGVRGTQLGLSCDGANFCVKP